MDKVVFIYRYYFLKDLETDIYRGKIGWIIECRYH